LTANNGAAIGKWPIVVTGSATVAGGRVELATQMAELEISDSFFSFAFEKSAAELGQETELVVNVENKIPFDGEAEVQLLGLPANTSTKPEPIKIKKDSAQMVFPIKVGDELDVVLAADVNDDHSCIALGGPQKAVRIYSTETGELLHQIKKHTDWVYAVRYSPDGVLLATGDRANGLFVWEAETAREYLDLRGHKGPVCDVAWRPDSNVLASASMDGTVKLWEMNEGKNVKSWNAHGGGVMCASYTHDGRIVTAGRDKTAKAWKGDGNLLKQFPAFAEFALEATFTHDGGRVVAGD